MSVETLSYRGEIVAKGALDYRLKRYLLALVLLVYGLMSIRDGFYRYPRENQEARELGHSNLPHPGFDVPMNQGFGVALPPLSIIFLIWVLFNSRGSYRYDGTHLQIPGHPAIPLNAVRRLDRSKWDRKGIAYVDYQIPGTNTEGRFRLDDFIYEQKPTDQIFDLIVNALGGTPEGSPADPAGTSPASTRPAAIAPTPIFKPTPRGK